MLKKLAFLLLISLLVLNLSCGKSKKSDKSEDGVVEVEFWHAMGGPLGEVLNRMVDDFNSKNPDIHVKSVSMGRYQALSQKIMASVQAGEPPVIAQAYETWTSQLITSKSVEPMEKYINGPNGLSEENFQDIVKVLRENNTWNGKTWSFPFNKSVPVLYYNKDLFEENGIENPPTTWEEFREVCEKLTQDTDGDGTVDIQGTAFPVSAWAFECLLLQNGGDILGEDGNAAFNSPEGVEALQYLKSLLDENLGYMAAGYSHQDDFLAQKVGIIQGTIVSIGFMKPKLSFNMGIAPLPKRKESGVILSGTNVVIFSDATDAQKKAAWKFIKWFTSTENTARWSAGTYYLPVRESALDAPQMQANYVQFPGYKEAAAQVKIAEFEPRTNEWFNGRRYLEDALEMALRGEMTPEEALDEAAEKYNSELAE
jgi:multiple sugar transport system substrate-binding protein